MTTIDDQLNALTQFMQLDDLRARVAAATTWIGREPETLIASTSIGADGINLSALVLRAGDLIVEVKLDGRYDNFDMMKFALYNIRVTLGVHEVKAGEELVARYHTATVQLQHSSSIGFGTILSYAGKEPADQWLSSVRAAFPTNVLAIPG